MAHIHQIGSDYTVVKSEGYSDLTQHPAIVNEPDKFEIVETDAPKYAQYLDYVLPLDGN